MTWAESNAWCQAHRAVDKAEQTAASQVLRAAVWSTPEKLQSVIEGCYGQ